MIHGWTSPFHKLPRLHILCVKPCGINLLFCFLTKWLFFVKLRVLVPSWWFPWGYHEAPKALRSTKSFFPSAICIDRSYINEFFQLQKLIITQVKLIPPLWSINPLFRVRPYPFGPIERSYIQVWTMIDLQKLILKKNQQSNEKKNENQGR